MASVLIGHFDNEIQVDRLNTLRGVKRINAKPQYDKYVLPNGRTIYLLAEGERSRPGCCARRLVAHNCG